MGETASCLRWSRLFHRDGAQLQRCYIYLWGRKEFRKHHFKTAVCFRSQFGSRRWGLSPARAAAAPRHPVVPPAGGPGGKEAGRQGRGRSLQSSAFCR